MKRSNRMEKIQNIKLGFEQKAGNSLAISKNEYQQQINQLEQLKIYKKEYKEKLSQRLQDKVSAIEIRDYQFFFSSIDQAIALQEQTVSKYETALESSRLNWLEKKQDTRKISRVTEKMRKAENMAQLKVDQKESDELSQRLYGKQINATPSL